MDAADRAAEILDRAMTRYRPPAHYGRLDRVIGRCTECGEDIGNARLKAMPYAQRCLPCQMVWKRHQ